MKTIYFLYAILFKRVSIIQICEDWGIPGAAIKWGALDSPQDGYGGHSGTWVEAPTAIEAVWKLRNKL